MSRSHKNFEISKCGLLINKEFPFLHATCDFLCSCDCCGLGCGEVKCPFCIEGCDFERYITKTVSCLEKVDDVLNLKGITPTTTRCNNSYLELTRHTMIL